MKNFKYLLTLICCVLIVASCDSIDFGSVNEDDDSPAEPNTESLMSGAMNRFFTLTGRNYYAKPSLYVQYQSQVTYTAEQRYNTAPVSWQGYYVQTLSNLKQVIDITTADEVPSEVVANGAPENQAGVAMLMSAFIYKRVTDAYGPIPYTEALNPEENVTPAYTSQEEVYNDLFAKVKAARDMMDTGKAGPTGDVVHGGDVSKWKKFANSFLMSLAIQISDAAPDKAETEFVAALNNEDGVIDEVPEEFWYSYQNTVGAENPISQFRGADYQMSLPFTRALQGKADGTYITYSNDSFDDRLNVFASDPSLDGRPYGQEVYEEGEVPGLTGSFSSYSSAINSADSPLPYMTAAYTFLNRAEAANRGWTSENAQLMLTTGIQMSYATVDAHWDDGSATSGNLQSDGTTFAASRVADAGIEQVIAEEKWVALFPMGFQSWSEWRRTDYPGLIPAVEATNSGEIPTRYIYPDGESGSNPESYQGGVNQLSPAEDSNTSKFWWEMGS